MKWRTIWRVGKVVVQVLDAKGIDVKGVQLGTIEKAIEKAASRAALEIKAAKPKASST